MFVCVYVWDGRTKVGLKVTPAAFGAERTPGAADKWNAKHVERHSRRVVEFSLQLGSVRPAVHTRRHTRVVSGAGAAGIGGIARGTARNRHRHYTT